MSRVVKKDVVWQFKPPWWAVLLTTLACAAALSLGFWQLQRSGAKRGLLQDYLEAAAQPPVPLDLKMPASPQPRAVVVRGRYESQRQLLLDNQTQGQRPGYQVWTPLRLESGELIVVNRGWIQQFARREQPEPLPAPGEIVELSGLWRSLPQAGLQPPPPPCARAMRFPHFVVYPQAAELACLLGEPVAEGVLLLDPRAASGYVREWHFSELIPPERHVGYALQWFAIALAMFILFIKLNLKPTSKHD